MRIHPSSHSEHLRAHQKFQVALLRLEVVSEIPGNHWLSAVLQVSSASTSLAPQSVTEVAFESVGGKVDKKQVHNRDISTTLTDNR